MLELDRVTIAYGETQAVEDFSLHMEPGEIVSLVGESGSGKTSVIRGILGLLPGGGAVTQGNIIFDGKDLLDVTPEQWRTVRGREISMIFQDSGAMMNPTRKIGTVFAEYLRTHEKLTKKEAKCLPECDCQALKISCAPIPFSSPAVCSSGWALPWP